MSFELNTRIDTLEGEFPSFMPGLWESGADLNFNFIEENLDSALTKALNNYYINKKLGDISVEYVYYTYDEDDEEIEHIIPKKLSDYDIDISVVDKCNDSNYCGGIQICINAWADWANEDDITNSPYNASFIALQVLETELNNDEEFYNTIIDDAYMELI
jgi:hypothetical protein